MEKERVKINKAEVVKLLEQGYTKSEVKEQLYPTLNDSQWNKALKAMQLSSYKVKKIDFVIEDIEPVVGEGSSYNPANQ